MNAYHHYYLIKRFIPRRVQIALRQYRALIIRSLSGKSWPILPRAAERPAWFTQWPGGKRFALVLRHDVESEIGHARCDEVLKLESGYGLRSSFFMVPEGYKVDSALRSRISVLGGEVGVHGLKHDGTLYASHTVFRERAIQINRYLHEWGATGFASPSAHHKLDWLHALDIEYDTSTFDTDPFEPQPDAAETIFPFLVGGEAGYRSYVEMPYTMPQDFTLFVILREKSIRIWIKKLDWIVNHGGMVLLNTHPDYMYFDRSKAQPFTYPVDLYRQFLDYVIKRYRDQYWAALPGEVAAFCRLKSKQDVAIAAD